MRNMCRDILSAVFMGLIIPGILLNLGTKLLRQETAIVSVRENMTEQTQKDTQDTVVVRIKNGGEMDLEEYLNGVLLAEMPVYFEAEALKAQAVVARTYARKAYETGGKHGDGSVCMESTCCQGYYAPEEYLLSGGMEEDLEKIRLAIEATRGQVLTYDGALIEATYFSCSGGRTEDAAAVWGTDVPYLQSVESPGEENAAYYRDVKTFSREEFAKCLGLMGEVTVQTETVEYTQGGAVRAIQIGENTYSGTQLRSLLSLRSAAFSIKDLGDVIEVTTKGYGHRVGMSQFGADAMAVSGSTWQEILCHYYPGTEITSMERETHVS